MIKLLIMPALLLSSSIALSDSWKTEDKKLHFNLSVLISSVSTGIYGQLPIKSPALAGFNTCALGGAVKEAIDANGLGEASWKDFGADLAGCALGSWIGKTWFVEPQTQGFLVGKRWSY